MGDPFFREFICIQAKECFGILQEEKISGQESAPLYTFLSKSLNLELINIILQGITHFCQDTSYPEWEEFEQFPVRKLELNRIVFNKANLYNVAQQVSSEIEG